MRALRYALDEAFASLWRGRQAGLLSTATIALALFVVGAFLLVIANLERLGEDWSTTAELSIYLRDDVTATEQRAIETTLGQSGIAAAQEYVSKSDALARFKQTFGELAAATEGLGDNPLPASIEVRLRRGPSAGAGLESLGARLRQAPGVADVRYDRQWLDRVVTAIGIIRRVGLTLGSLLTIAAALTIANVVRLALYARRDELAIMQLVGAPSVYLRGPFVMEGVLQGGFGAVLALAALALAFAALRARYLSPLASAVNLSSVQFLPMGLCLLLVAGGMAVGCIGGGLAARLTES
jgi:cell division transport system permease protein